MKSKKVTESSSKRGSKWFKKESSKHPGRFYYVNAETGESSWKRPADFVETGVKPFFAPPPGLSLPAPAMPKNVVAPSPHSLASLTVPEDAEMCFDDLRDLPMAGRARSASRLASNFPVTVN